MGAIVKKFQNFFSVGVARSKTEFFRVYRVPFDYPAHSLQESFTPKPMVSTESRDSEGVRFPSLHGKSVTRHLANIAPEGCRKVVI